MSEGERGNRRERLTKEDQERKIVRVREKER